MSDARSLLDAAREAAAHSYSPYSGFRVGAALRWDDGTVTTGTNVENVSLGLTLCAERSAAVQGAGRGARRIAEVAVWADGDEPAAPCGACLQVLLEFSPAPDSVVVHLGGRSTSRQTSLGALAPEPFTRF